MVETNAMSPPQSIDELLAQAPWIRGLALRLARDEAAADDLVQDAWVLALRRPPRHVSQARGWFTRVLTNLARQRRRSEGRRRAREERAGRPEASPDPQQLAADRFALHQRLMQAVDALDEPVRGTILLRYLEERSAAEIATLQGVPVSTVHTRLQRGLARLRTRLDGEHGGRSAWIALVLPTGLAVQPPAGAAGGTASEWVRGVSSGWKLAAGLVATVAAVGVWSRPDGTDDPLVGSRLADAPGTSAPAHAREPFDDRTPERLALRRAGSDGTSTIHSSVLLGTGQHAARAFHPGLVVDLEGAGAGGLDVWFQSDDGEPEFVARTSGDGTFPATAFDAPGVFVVEDELVGTLYASRFEPGPPTEHVVVVAPRVAIGGSVRSTTGEHVSRARVRIVLPESLRARLPVAFDSAEDRLVEVESDAEGDFRLDGALVVPDAHLEISHPAYCAGRFALRRDSIAGAEFVLEPVESERGAIRGRVLDPGGRAVAGARVSFGGLSTVSDEAGRFQLVHPDDPATARLVAVAAGRLPAVLERPREPDGTPGDWPPFVELVLGHEALAITGRVVDASGAPVPGVRVWPTDTTLFGRISGEGVVLEGLVAGRPEPLDGTDERTDNERNRLERERLEREGTAFCPWVRTDADGRFHLEGLLDRAYTLRVFDDRSLLRVDSRPIEAGRTGVVLTFDPGLVTRGVRGRVLDEDGRPLAGIRVRSTCATQRLRLDAHGAVTWRHEGAQVETGAGGAFEFSDLPHAGVELVFEAADRIPRTVALDADGIDPHALDVTLERRTHLQVRTADPAWLRAVVSVLDAAGETVPLRILFADGTITTEEVSLAGGASEVFVVPGDARELRLTRSGAEPLRIPLVLVPGRLNQISIP